MRRASNSPLNDSSVGRAAALLVANGERAAETTETFDQALAAVRQLTATAPFDRASPLLGREGGSDVIVFVMETGAAQALDVVAVGRDLPGAGPLYDHSFVAPRHYTTHPYSSDAVYSVLSGMYPQGRRRLVRQAAAGSLNGLMSAVASEFPMRRVYVPSVYQLELDDRIYEAFGVDQVFVSDRHSADPLRSVAERRADELITARSSVSRLDGRSRAILRDRLVADFQAMEQMKSDIAAAINAGQRSCVIFFPEIGHGPWLDLHGNESVRARGRALMLLQDAWLKEIVDQVRGAGRLQRTIIALTGDHGVRTRAEDPALEPGTISDYTFRVPLLIHAPQTLSHTFVVSDPTSHIDLAPTILGLLGAVEPAGRMQGVPIWQRAATNPKSTSWRSPTASCRTARTTCVRRCRAPCRRVAICRSPTTSTWVRAIRRSRSSTVRSRISMRFNGSSSPVRASGCDSVSSSLSAPRSSSSPASSGLPV